MRKTISTAACLLLLAAAGCKKGGNAVENGSTVSFDYTLTVDGQTADSSKGRGPLTVKIGSHQIIPGLEEQLIGMKKGEKKKVTVPPEKGYGPINPKAVQTVPKKAFQGAGELKVGGMVQGQANGRKFQAVVRKVGAKTVTLDLNHSLAGKTLNFDVEIVEVKAPAS